MFMFVLAFFILVSAPTFLFALDQIRRGVFFYLIRFDCTQKSDRELQISHELQSAQLSEKRWSHGSLIVAVRPSDAPREKVNRQNRKQSEWSRITQCRKCGTLAGNCGVHLHLQFQFWSYWSKPVFKRLRGQKLDKEGDGDSGSPAAENCDWIR